MAGRNGNSFANLGFGDKLRNGADRLASNREVAGFTRAVLYLIFLEVITRGQAKMEEFVKITTEGFLQGLRLEIWF